jgi:hypothetical protein
MAFAGNQRQAPPDSEFRAADVLSGPMKVESLRGNQLETTRKFLKICMAYLPSFDRFASL